MRKMQINRWTVLKVLLTVGLVIFCLGVWPGYLIHTYWTADLHTSDISQTQLLATGDIVRQYFLPEDSWLSKIKIALVFDESEVNGEILNFTLVDDTGRDICSREIYFNEIEDSSYFDIAVEEKLNPGSEYMWSLTMHEPTTFQYAVLCTGDVNGNARENRSLSVNGADTQRNAVNQYVYYAHYDKAVIIGGFWAGAVLVWLLLLELTDRADSLFERKKHVKE